jgi:hypothetical protein
MAAGIRAHLASSPQAIPPSFAPNGVYADFDGDLKLDLAWFQRSILHVHRGDGSEQRFAASFEQHLLGFGIAVVDLDDDDDLDLIIQNRISKQSAGIWINDGTGFFTESMLRTLPDSFGHRSWWSAALENETEDLIDVERFELFDCLPAAELPSLLSSSSDWHVFSTRNAMPGHDEAFHLRGPPSSSSM